MAGLESSRLRPASFCCLPSCWADASLSTTPSTSTSASAATSKPFFADAWRGGAGHTPGVQEVVSTGDGAGRGGQRNGP